MAHQKNWSALSITKVRSLLDTECTIGLNPEEVESRLKQHGKNTLKKEGEVGLLGKVFRQFKSPLVLILLFAGIATLLLGEYLDATVIFIALLINVVIGTFQEERASRAFERLNESQEKFATVIRGGRRMIVKAENLVPGDVVLIESGAYVPADVRLFKTKNLTINEAALTGEWVDVAKEPSAVSENAPVSGQFNMAWMGTLVTGGFGKGIVAETGAQTQVGEIAASLGDIEEQQTPLQKNIHRIAQFLVYVISAAILLIFVLGLLRGEPFAGMLLIAIAIAVAAMPQGLPAAVTVVLALGMESILKRGGLVRNLLAAETLGATTMILTDKTGTLTQARMQLAEVLTLETIKAADAESVDDDDVVLKMAVSASDAFIEENDEGEQIVEGRPIEKAITERALTLGFTQDELFSVEPRVDFLPFESDRGYAASLNKRDGANRLYISGIPETLIAQAGYVYRDGKAEKMTEEIREEFKLAQGRKSGQGLRLIAIAYTDVDWDAIPSDGENPDEHIFNQDLVLAGLLVFEDPVREDVRDAIAKVEGAGAEVIMLTGDNPATARKIAIDVGITSKNGKVLVGKDIERLSDEDLLETLDEVSVFARVLPKQKLRIARLLKGRGEVVAMTGDGVNDAPALRSANIGVAVGSGTEVAKESSDMVLLNDSFAIIVAAIEEGRKIIDNLKKIVAYLLSTSFSEILLIGGALIVGTPLPLLPVQILWANIVEEGLMSFSFAFEPKEPGLMKRNPRSAQAKRVLTKDLKKMIFSISIVTGVFLLGLYFALLYFKVPIDEIRTIMFVALSLDSIFFAFSLKMFKRPVWQIKIGTNKYLIVALLLSILLLIAAVTLPPLQALLSLVSLNAVEIALLVGVGLFNLLTIELTKYILFEKRERELG